ncbi:MAG: hypothetical protein H7X71_07765 [Chitinophagales bacterium]|nr:hypothetical protein [Chitinophagales bacterium]
MQNPFQLTYFRILKHLLPENTSLPDALSEILQVSQDSAYRRLRGETALSIDEAIAICTHYKLPISLFVQNVPGLATFRYVSPDTKQDTFKKYIAIQLKATEELLDHEDSKLLYAAIDTPLFHYYGYELLCVFKIHFWMKVILGVEELKGNFSPADIDKDLISTAKKIHEGYMQIPSVEIWSDNILDTSLKQIEFYWESGYFNKKNDAIAILETFTTMIHDIETMAEKGTKLVNLEENKHFGAYQLYQSDILLGNNTVMAFAGENRSAYISHQTFNMLICNEEAYCNETENWFKKIMSKSTLISGVSEKNRTKFFKKMHKQILDTTEKIQHS